MNLFEESVRIKNLMRIDEQTSLDTFLQEFISGNFDKLKEFLTGLKEAFKQVGINPDEIDWSPTNVMNYKGSYVLVDV